MKRSGLNTAMLMALIGGGLAGCSHNCYDRGEGCFSGGSSSGGSSVSTKGTVVDGYVSGANVYLANSDGSCSTTVAGTTDSSGNYTLSVAAPNGICAAGGTDLSTGKPLVGTLQAPAGSTVVTPLTTMFAYALKSNPNLTESSFATSLGLTLSPGQSLLTLDPLSAGAPSNLEQVGAAIQTLIASIATSLGGSANAGAVYGDVVNAVLSAVSSGSVNLATLAASGNFSSIAATVATTAQTNVASDPSLAGNSALLASVAAITPAQLTADANAAASSASSSAASNSPPPAAFTELAAVTANSGAVTGTVQPVQTTTPAYDSQLTIPHGAFNNVTFTLATATGNALVSSTGNTVTISVSSLASGSSQNLTVSIPTDWSETPSNNGTITPSIESGSVVTVTGTRSDGSVLSATLPAATLISDETLTTSAGAITLNLAQLYTDLSTSGVASNTTLALLAAYNNGTGTTAGKSYVVTTTLSGLALKTVESPTSAPVSTFSYTTEILFQ